MMGLSSRGGRLVAWLCFTRRGDRGCGARRRPAGLGGCPPRPPPRFSVHPRPPGRADLRLAGRAMPPPRRCRWSPRTPGSQPPLRHALRAPLPVCDACPGRRLQYVVRHGGLPRHIAELFGWTFESATTWPGPQHRDPSSSARLAITLSVRRDRPGRGAPRHRPPRHDHHDPPTNPTPGAASYTCANCPPRPANRPAVHCGDGRKATGA